MKKFFIYFLCFICIIFILPAVFTKRKRKIEIKGNENFSKETKEEIPKFNYNKFEKIKLYHCKTGEIEELPLDEYLYGVVSAEMPANYSIEAVKAQAIVARTYTLYQIKNGKGKHNEADICDDSTCCQAWISKEDRMAKWEEDVAVSNWDKITNAVDSTQGMVITYNGSLIDAFFHSNSGGITETASNVWGGENYPYLQSVETSGEEGYSGYNSEIELTKDELVGKLKQNYPNVQINFDDKNCIQILEYTQSGRVKIIKFGNTEMLGTEARMILGLKSTKFTYEINADKIKFSTIGYGHGVGMSQTGADALAQSGSNYEEIIKHFYTGVEIKNVNNIAALRNKNFSQ